MHMYVEKQRAIKIYVWQILEYKKLPFKTIYSIELKSFSLCDPIDKYI